MSMENPYTPPAVDSAPLVAADSAPELAKLGDRFLGSLLDGLIGILIVIPLWGGLYLLGVFRSVEEMGRIGLGYTLLISVLHYVLFMAIQWKSLNATGQTIGKKAAKTRIATMDGSKPPVWDIVFKRYGFVTVISMIPFLGVILTWIDILLIFKKDRRCLHDLVAGTQVLAVRTGP